MTPALDYTYLGAGMGVLLLLALGWTLTSYPWHNWFHQNRARYLLRDRVVCAHCVREWMTCLHCGHRPCVCKPGAEAQAWVAEEDATMQQSARDLKYIAQRAEEVNRVRRTLHDQGGHL